MSYKSQKRSSYQVHRTHRPSAARGFRKSDKERAHLAFDARSERSKAQDLVQLAEITPNLQAWLRSPNRLDFAGVDTPDARLIFSHKSKQSQAADLARAAKRRVPLEIWIKDTTHSDLKGVDTKNAKQGPTVKPKIRKFKIVPKKKTEKVKKTKLEKQKALDHEFLNGKISNEEYESKRISRMPKKEEIIEKAQAIHMEKEAKQGLPTLSATEQELKESGEFEAARTDLMRGETNKADSQMLVYIDELRHELDAYGFDIVERD